MTAIAFTAAFAVSAVILIARAWHKRRERRAWRAGPGRSPERAIGYERFDEIDAAVRVARCPLCGGRCSTVSEGATEKGDGEGRVVHLECVQCEEETDLFFKRAQTKQDRVLH